MKKIMTVILAMMICLQAFIPCLAFEELSKGSRGDAVVELQNRLNELGYDVGKADGDFGGKTEKAIQKYQEDNSLDITGTVNEQTYAALFSNDETSESNENMEMPEFGNSEIIDIWLTNYGIRFYTDDGNVWEYIPVQMHFPEPVIEIIASDIKRVIQNNGTNDLFIGNDGIVQLNNAASRQYELDDEWHDIVIASANMDHAVGLRNDGVWVVAGAYANGECDVDDWVDVVSVATGSRHTVALKSDGTVVATGLNDCGQCNVSDWKDIIQVAAGGSQTLGLKKDGTVIATGDNKYGQCNVSEWKDVVYIDCCYTASFAITKDGALYTTDDEEFKGSKYFRLIPRKYKCDNAKRIDADFFLNGRLMVIKEDNSIELFGDNGESQCEQMMDLINSSNMTIVKSPTNGNINLGKHSSEEQFDDNTQATDSSASTSITSDSVSSKTSTSAEDGLYSSDLVEFRSVLVQSISDQITSAADLTTSPANRAVLAALLSLEYKYQDPNVQFDYSLPIYVCKQGNMASVVIASDGNYIMIIYQNKPLSTSYGILYGSDPAIVKATLDSVNEQVWQVSLENYNQALSALVAQLS